MNKNFKIITISGVRGIITAAFLVFGLAAGFVISPGWVCMRIWNYVFQNSSTVALMNIYQGIMFWAIIALSLYALNNKRALIGFGSYHGLSPEQIHEIMQRAKEADFEQLKKFECFKNNLNNLGKEDTDKFDGEIFKENEDTERAEK